MNKTSKNILYTEYLFCSYLGFIANKFDVYPINENGDLNKPIVLKYDGLAQGKGVSICKHTSEIKDFIKSVYIEKKFK